MTQRTLTLNGVVKSDYILLKGSIPGSSKRTVVFTEPLRKKSKMPQIEILSINQESKQ
jgi:large subunit ribosomal protein L3